jgi:tetratricopeptide (TPR) repeat protein
VELLAHHYLSALEYADTDSEAKAALGTQACIALRDAGDRAFTLNAFVQATGFYRDALALWPTEEPARPQLLFRYASALHVTGDRNEEQALEDARQALSAAGDLETAAEADLLLAEMWWIRGRGDHVEHHLQHAASLVSGRGGSPAKARVLAAAARFRMLAGEMEEAIQVGREALALAEALGLQELLADALITVGTARCAAGDGGGEADLERGTALALEANALRVAQRGYNNLADAMGRKGSLAERIKLLKEAYRLADQLGATQNARFHQSHIVEELIEQGNWDEALEIADEFIALCETESGHRQEAPVLSLRAWIRLARGQEERALADWERALALVRRPGGGSIPLLALGARINAELGRLAEAQALADEVLSYDAEAVARDGTELAWVAARIERSAELKAKLAAAPDRRGHWRQLADLLLAGDAVIAADRVGELTYWLTEADARLLAARQLVEQDHSEDAKEQLTKALPFYRSVGATRFIREAEALLGVEAHA